MFSEFKRIPGIKMEVQDGVVTRSKYSATKTGRKPLRLKMRLWYYTES